MLVLLLLLIVDVGIVGVAIVLILSFSQTVAQQNAARKSILEAMTKAVLTGHRVLQTWRRITMLNTTARWVWSPRGWGHRKDSLHSLSTHRTADCGLQMRRGTCGTSWTPRKDQTVREGG